MKQLTESDIRARLITPAIEQAGWDPMTQIFHEFGLRAGRISVRGRAAHRDQATILKAEGGVYGVRQLKLKRSTRPVAFGNQAQVAVHQSPACFASAGRRSLAE